jgi:hypothetical protein
VEELLLQARWKTIEYDADNTMLAQIAEAGVGSGEGVSLVSDSAEN